MKNLLLFLTFNFIVSVGLGQIQPNTWIHSYIKLKTHWDPSQVSIEVRTCIRQETTPTLTAPGEGYYQTFVDPANVTYALTIDGNVVPFSGSAIVSNFNLGSTVPVTLLAQVAGFPDYQFSADIFVDPINPSITYNTVPNSTVFNIPASLLRTVKGDAGGCDGELNLNISGGYPFTGSNPYAVHYDNPTNYHLDYLHNLCATTTVNYKWGDDWWGCKGNYCDPNISPNCTPSTVFCNNDGFFCDGVTIDPRSCNLNDIIGQPYYCAGDPAEFELTADPGSSSYTTSFTGGGVFSDIYNPYEILGNTFAMSGQNYMATVTHHDGSVFSCYAALNVEFGNPYLNLLSDSLDVCLGDTLIFEAGASWFYGDTWSYDYTLYGNQYTSSSDSIIVVTDSLGAFDLTLDWAYSDMGCFEPGGNSFQYEVIDCDTLENPVAGFECLSSNVICMDSCVTFQSNSLYGANPSFEWDFGNGQTHFTENISAPVCYDSVGYYTVSLTVTDDSGTDTYLYAMQVVNCDPANLGSFESNGLDFTLYPNPTNSEFTVSVEGFQPESFEVFVYDILGNRIQTKSISKTDNQKMSFNLENYSSGIYYVELRTSGQSLVKKIVLN